MNTHTATLALIFGQEVSFGTIAGPVDFIDVYVDGNAAPNAIVEWRLYAIVGTLTSLVAISTGGGKKASVLKWQGAAGAYSPVQADGSTYELRGYWAQQGSPPTMKASIVGYDEFDTATASGSSSTQVVPAGFGEVTFASAAGYSQFADAAVEQNFRGNVLFILYALSEGGGVEAPIDTQLLSSEDGTTRIFASLKLPGATSYRLAAQDPTGAGGQSVKASLACFSIVKTGTAQTPGPQISVLRSVTPTTPTSIVWASSGYIDFVADCGADPTGAVDCAAAFDRAFVLLSALGSTAGTAKTALKLFMPPGLYALKSAPATPTWNFNTLTTSLEIVGSGIDASVIQLHGFDPPAPANLMNCRIADVTLLGTGAGVVNDCIFGWLPQSVAELCLFERVRGHNVRAQFSVIGTFACLGSVNLANCVFTCCSSQTNGFGVMTVRAFVTARVMGCVCQDVGEMNGIPENGNVLLAGRSWLAFVGNNAVAGAFAVADVSDCYFDENVLSNVLLIGEAGAPLKSVIFKNCFFNPPVQPGALACITASNLTYLACDGVENSGLIGSAATSAFMSLTAIAKVDLTALRVRTGASSNYITADATTGLIVVRSSDSDIDIFAPLVIYKDLYATGVALAAGGTFAADFPLTLPCGAKFSAEVEMSDPNGTTLANLGSLIAKCVVQNVGGHLAFVAPIPTSANPMNSANYATLEPEVASAGFVGVAAPTAVWSISGNNVRLTVTNPGASNAQVAVDLEKIVFQGTQPVLPSAMAGISAWYRADTQITVVAGKISQWECNPLVGDASKSTVQAVAGQRPAFNPANANYASKPTIDFTRANSNFLASGLWNAALAQGHTIVIVGNDDGTAAFQVAADNQPGSVVTCALANDDTVHIFYSINAGAWLNSTIPPSATPKCMIGIYNGVASKIYISQNTANVTGNAGGNARTSITIGADATPADFWNGPIADILVFDHALSAAEVASVNAYVNNRYKIAIAA